MKRCDGVTVKQQGSPCGRDADSREECPVDPADGGVTIRVYVAPRASVNRIVGLHEGALKVTLTAPPVGGAANRALVELLARILGLPRSNLSIISGERARRKVVKAFGITRPETLDRLGL